MTGVGDVDGDGDGDSDLLSFVLLLMSTITLDSTLEFTSNDFAKRGSLLTDTLMSFPFKVSASAFGDDDPLYQLVWLRRTYVAIEAMKMAMMRDVMMKTRPMRRRR